MSFFPIAPEGMKLVDTRPPHVYCKIPLRYVRPLWVPYTEGRLDSQAFADKLRRLFVDAAEAANEDSSVFSALANPERFRVVDTSPKVITLDLGRVLPGSHWIASSTSDPKKSTLEEALRKLLLDKLVPLKLRREAEAKFLVYQTYPSNP